ncbi:MAG: MarR family transcriptional regulator [Longimicrobiales bacterium]
MLRRGYAAVLEPQALTHQQFNVLRILRNAKGGRGTPTLDIGASLIEQAPGVTRLLDRLEDKALVRRERSADDRRIVLCWITAAGRELIGRLETEVAAVDSAALDGFDPDDLQALLETLESIRISAPSRR